MNQCDGCQRGLPINKHGNHQGEGYDIIGCTKHLYEGERMSKHTPEPWSFYDTGPEELIFIESRNGNSADATIASVHTCNDDARRIVACVNACAGLPTEYLEKVKISGIMAGYEDRNAELLEALELLHKNCLYQISEEDDRVTHVDHKLFAVIESAIAKAKGEV